MHILSVSCNLPIQYSPEGFCLARYPQGNINVVPTTLMEFFEFFVYMNFPPFL